VSKISQKNFDKIAQDLLRLLYDSYPVALSTTKVASELARDNEFAGRVLAYLEQKGFVLKKAKANRVDWLLSKSAKEKFDRLA